MYSNPIHMEDPTINELLNDKMNNNSTIALSLQQIANSASQIAGCLVAKSEVKNESEAVKQRQKPYNVSTLRTRSTEQRRRPTGIMLEYSDLMVLNEAVSKLSEVVSRLNEEYENQATTSSSSHAAAAVNIAPSPSSTLPPPSEDDIEVLEMPTADISNHINHIQDNNDAQLDPLINITNGLSSCLKPCLIVSKDDNSVYEYTIQKKRCGNEYYCCSSCRKLPSPRSNLAIYSDGKITCSLHNPECIPISKEESIKKQEKRQNRIRKSNIDNNVVIEE